MSTKRTLDLLAGSSIFLLSIFLSFTTVSLVGDSPSPFPLGLAEAKPYKDFFWPTPPGSVLRGELASLTPIPLQIWHSFGALTSLVFYVSLRRLAPSFTSTPSASIAGAVVGTLFFVSLTLERGGGWNQVSFSLLAYCLSVLIRELNPKESVRTWTFGLVGFALTWTVLEKQTALLVAGPLGAVLVGLILRTRQQKMKFLCLMAGILAPVVVVGIWLAANSIDPRTVLQMIFDGSSKGEISTNSVLTIFVSNFLRPLRDGLTLLLTIASCMFIIWRSAERSSLLAATRTGVHVTSQSAHMHVTGLFVPFLCLGLLSVKAILERPLYMGILMCLFIAGYATSLFSRQIFVGGVVSSAALVLAISDIQIESVIFHDQVTAWAIGVVTIVALWIAVDTESSNLLKAKWLALFGYSALVALMGALSGPLISWNLAVIIGVLAAVLWDVFSSVLGRSVGGQIGRFLGLFVFGICLSVVTFSTLSNPFRWWGWQSGSVAGRLEPVSSDHLRGFYLPSDDAQFFNELDASMALVSDSHDLEFVLGYPNLSVAVNMTDIDPLILPCTNLFWDLCPDSYALSALEQLKALEDIAGLIVWHSPSSTAISVHESLYRGGAPSALREWEKYREDMTRSGRWVEVFSLTSEGNDDQTAWPVRIFLTGNSTL